VRLRALVVAGLLGALGAVGIGAEEGPRVDGRLDSSWAWSAADGGAEGTVAGRVGVAAGGPQVKTELRFLLAGLDGRARALAFDRAWVKFRVPGWRFTSGLGRLSWGPAQVWNPGDLLFDSTSTAVDFSAEDLRAAPAWLADAWLALGDEAFVEALGLARSAGVRAQGVWGPLTLEGAGAWDQATQTAKAAASLQLPFGGDWYLTLRQDSDGRRSALGGFFALGSGGEGPGWASRHEVWADSRAGLHSYHDLGLSFDGRWTVTLRALADEAEGSWSPSLALGWGPLEGLTLHASSTLEARPLVRLGATATW